MAIDLLIHSIGELATPSLERWPAHGADMQKVLRIKNAAIAIAGNKIVHVGDYQEVIAKSEITDKTVKLDAGQKLVTPGLVDPHTHLIFAGNRANEFSLRCQGQTYAQIAAAGGGIIASVRATRDSSIDQLVSLAAKRLEKMLACGTTTAEVKTGYGLSLDSELKMLSAIYELQNIQPVELVPTFMAAHAIPAGIESKQYVKDIVEVMLPAVIDLVSKSGNQRSVPFNDVFCDQGYFSLPETKAILERGLELGMRPKVHADEFANLGATKLAVDLNAQSADHLLNVSDEEIDLLAKSNTVAVLLPGTSFFLNLKEHARARKMIDSGCAVALGSDFNPGSCHIYSLPFICGLALLQLGMKIEEALTALTINAACAIGKGDTIGQVKPGYQADLVIYNLNELNELPYNLVSNPVASIVKNGKVIKTGGELP